MAYGKKKTKKKTKKPSAKLLGKGMARKAAGAAQKRNKKIEAMNKELFGSNKKKK